MNVISHVEQNVLMHVFDLTSTSIINLDEINSSMHRSVINFKIVLMRRYDELYLLSISFSNQSLYRILSFSYRFYDDNDI